MRMAPVPHQSDFLDRLGNLPDPYDPTMQFARIIGNDGTDKRPFATIKITKLAEALLDRSDIVNQITIPLVISPQRFSTPKLKRACMWETAVWEDDPLNTTYGILPVCDASDTGMFRATDICSMAYPSPANKSTKPHGRTAQCPVFTGSLFVLTYMSNHRHVQATYQVDGFLPLPPPVVNQLRNSKIEYVAANATLIDCVLVLPDTNNGKPVVWTKDGYGAQRSDIVRMYERAVAHHDSREQYPVSCHMFWMDDTPDIEKIFDHGVEEIILAETGDIFAEIRAIRTQAINAPYDRRAPDYTRYQPFSVRVSFNIPKEGYIGLRIDVRHGKTITVIEPRIFDDSLAVDFTAEPALFYRAATFDQLYQRIKSDCDGSSTTDVRYLRTHL